MVALDCQTLTSIIAHDVVIFQLMDLFYLIVFGRSGDVQLDIRDRSLLNAPVGEVLTPPSNLQIMKV